MFGQQFDEFCIHNDKICETTHTQRDCSYLYIQKAFQVSVLRLHVIIGTGRKNEHTDYDNNIHSNDIDFAQNEVRG